MGPVGVPEMFAIFVIALLLFGPKKLPELGRTLGKALSEFRRAKNELKGTFESHLRELEREANVSQISSSSTSSYSSNYSYPYEDYNQYNPESPDYTSSSHIGGTEEDHAALPAADSTSHVEHATCEHCSHGTLAPAEPVSGTVPRSNGVHPVADGVAAQATEHHVSRREEHPV